MDLITQLPRELLVMILGYLDDQNLIRCSRTCRLFRKLCFLSSFWTGKTIKVSHIMPSVKSNPLMEIKGLKFDLRKLTDSDMRLAKQFHQKNVINYPKLSNDFCPKCLHYIPRYSFRCKKCDVVKCKCEFNAIHFMCNDCSYRLHRKCYGCNGNQLKDDGTQCLTCKRFFCYNCIIKTRYYGCLCEDCIEQCPICNGDIPKIYLYPCSKCKENVCRSCISPFPKKIDVCIKCK